jgi:hypothetical protein
LLFICDRLSQDTRQRGDDTEKWEILEHHLPLVSRMKGFLRGSPSQKLKGYCTVEILKGSDADRLIDRDPSC